MNGIKNYLRIARFDHWIKQLFLLPGVVFAVVLIGFEAESIPAWILRFILVYIATSLIASANYIINEWLDAEFDRFHPIKKTRPVVTQNMKAPVIVAEYLIFAACGLLLVWFISFPIFISACLLLLMGILYNVKPVRFKDIPYLDVLTESINNALRLLIGWLIVVPSLLPPSSIVIGYWMGGAFLMGIKRFSEYRMIGDAEQAARYRKSFFHYSERSLLISSIFYALLSVFFIGIFMIKYRIELLIFIPVLCALFCYYIWIGYRKDSAAQKPEKLLHEKRLMLFVICAVVLFVVLLFVQIPALYWFTENAYIQIPGI